MWFNDSKCLLVLSYLFHMSSSSSTIQVVTQIVVFHMYSYVIA